MSLSEILLSVVAAAATLTPLILGLLKYAGDKKTAPTPAEAASTAPAPLLGDTIDFESLAVDSLKAQVALLTESHNDTRERLREALRDNALLKAHAARADADKRAAEAQRDSAFQALRHDGH